MERATNRLRLQIHRSFSSYSPFVDRPIPSRKSKALLLKNSSNSDISFNSACGTPTAPARYASPAAPGTNNSSFFFPTVLEMTQMSKGAIKSVRPNTPGSKRIASRENTLADAESVGDVQVRHKLLHATCLKASRELGLEISVTSLRSFREFGGTKRVATELVRCLSISSKDHEERSSVFQQKIKPFCESFAVDFDGSLLQYVKGLCGSKVATQESIIEAASGKC